MHLSGAGQNGLPYLASSENARCHKDILRSNPLTITAASCKRRGTMHMFMDELLGSVVHVSGA